MHCFGGNVRFVSHAVSDVQGVGGNFVAQAPPIMIVYVEHGAETFELLGIARHFVEQLRLGREVLVHILVEIQVVLCEIRKHTGIEGAARHTLHGQGVRRHFHHNRFAATV
jgi:hypothetical protein